MSEYKYNNNKHLHIFVHYLCSGTYLLFQVYFKTYGRKTLWRKW